MLPSLAGSGICMVSCSIYVQLSYLNCHLMQMSSCKVFDLVNMLNFVSQTATPPLMTSDDIIERHFTMFYVRRAGMMQEHVTII